MKIHELKTWPVMFQAMWDGRKSFDYRENDRPFEAADILILKEWDPDSKEYTGRELHVQVTYILTEECPGLPFDFCVMQIKPLPLPTRIQLKGRG